jgi:hypothetical protein
LKERRDCVERAQGAWLIVAHRIGSAILDFQEIRHLLP